MCAYETYWSLGILEANTIKQVEMKEKNKKGVSQTNDKTSQNQALQLKSHNNNEHPDSPP